MIRPPLASQHPQPSRGDHPLDVRIAQACTGEPTSLSADGILAALQAQAPELELCYAVARAGWHCLGGVVDGHYRSVARHIGE